MKSARFTLCTFTCALLLGFNATAAPLVTYDWDDGTLQGWTKLLPFNGNLGVDSSVGNGGGSMYATDTLAGGGGLVAIAPGWTGDFTSYSGVSWDEWVPDYGSSTVISTSVLIEGSDGTRYRSDNALGLTGQWNSKSASFLDASDWSLLTGTGTLSLDDVLLDVTGLFVSMDTSFNADGRVESWIDNFSINADVPEPSMLALMGAGLAGFGFARRRKKA